MLESESQIKLSTGEQVKLAVILCPDLIWAERIENLLSHKGEPWNWQNSQFLRTEVGFETRFYVLHRHGIPFANVLLSEGHGLGIVNHVWTIPEDRQKAASKSLMQVVMDDFKQRHGQAVYLQAGYGEVAYYMYQKFGFNSIEEQSGYMDWYMRSEKDFLDRFFTGEPRVLPLAWKHWLAIQPLLQCDDNCLVRIAALKHVGRRTTEGPFLNLLKEEFVIRAKGEKPRAFVLELASGAVAGLAMWSHHPFWPDTCVLDVYCHEDYWNHAKTLIDHLELKNNRVVAYADANYRAKQEVLESCGFRQSAVYKQRAAMNWVRSGFVDVVVYEK